MSTGSDNPRGKKDGRHPFRRAMVRGMAIALPPLLTIVVFLWFWHTIEAYVLKPIESGARYFIVRATMDERDGFPDDIAASQVYADTHSGDPKPVDSLPGWQPGAAFKQVAKANDAEIVAYEYDDERYVPLDPKKLQGKWIPEEVHTAVSQNPGDELPTTGKTYYERYVDITYLRREFVIPIFLVGFVLFLYLIGKFMAAGVGNMFWRTIEAVIHRLPIIRAVYSAVKQVTDFAFKEKEIEFTRIVAVQYPRKGVWSMGFVTGQSFLDIRSAANEPVVSVLMPTSPMPATGFIITVPKSETIDLDITIDQAIQFCVSCGVVIPPHQQASKLDVADAMTSAAKRLETGEQNGGKFAALPASAEDEPVTSGE